MFTKQWGHGIPEWDLQADPEDVEQRQACILVNGKPTRFADVHAGPAVYIGRSNSHYDLGASRLKNPYTVQDHGRLDACLQYVDHVIEQVQSDPHFRSALYRCHGRPLSCFCVPELCHGHVINLFLAYRLYCGWDLDRCRGEITDVLESHVDYLIRRGKIDPSKYQAVKA